MFFIIFLSLFLGIISLINQSHKKGIPNSSVAHYAIVLLIASFLVVQFADYLTVPSNVSTTTVKASLYGEVNDAANSPPIYLTNIGADELTGYSIKVAAVKDKEAAFQKASKLKQEYSHVFVYQKEDGWYRITVGHGLSKNTLDQFKMMLAQKFKDQKVGFVRLWKNPADLHYKLWAVS